MYQCLEILLYVIYTCMLCRECGQKVNSWTFHRLRRKGHREKEIVLEIRLENYNIIILESQEKTEFQDISKLNATHKKY